MSDHGDMMGDHWLNAKGPFHFEGLLHIPWIWSWPRRLAAGIRPRGLASQTDFAPTILDLCCVRVPEGVVPREQEAPGMLPPWPGRALRAQLTGAADRVQEAVIVENDEDYLGLRLRTLVTDRYKLTAYPGESFGELFDLAEDPFEQCNLWDDPACQRLRRNLTVQFFDLYVGQESTLPRRLSHA